jgi:hypothetical protein
MIAEDTRTDTRYSTLMLILLFTLLLIVDSFLSAFAVIYSMINMLATDCSVASFTLMPRDSSYLNELSSKFYCDIQLQNIEL